LLAALWQRLLADAQGLACSEQAHREALACLASPEYVDLWASVFAVEADVLQAYIAHHLGQA
jgi:hypothetical protein